MYVVRAAAQLTVWLRLCRAKSTLFFASSISALDHFRVDCGAEELPQGQHLVILVMDTSLKESSQASSVLRVYYEPPNSSMSEVGLPSLEWRVREKNVYTCG